MTVALAPEAAAAGPLTRRIRLGWLVELGAMTAIYVTYDRLRDLTAGSTRVAFQHAKQLVAAERWLGIYWER
ncbi:MAG: hypothetical protein JO004_08560, partial [Methylobacteriaceae bacterium]|nr:hypothetical protein [Methylobacteriaceae bacterium]